MNKERMAKVKLSKDVLYLFESKKSLDEQDDFVKIDIESVLSHDAIIAQQDLICGEVGLPTTIIQFRTDENGELERVDSQVSGITLRTSCDILRRCINNNGKLCKDCDSKHAELFRDLSFNNLRDGLLKKIEEHKDEWGQEYKGQKHDPIPMESLDRWYLMYYCPMFGYRELMFPIQFERKIIAVLIIGQIRHEDDEDIISTNKKNFLYKQKNIFKDYLEHEIIKKIASEDEEGRYTHDKIVEYVINNSKRELIPYYQDVFTPDRGLIIPEVKDKLSEREFQNVATTICKLLKQLEMIMSHEMQYKREVCVRMILGDALASFYANVNKDENLVNNIQETLWKNVHNFTDDLVKYAGISSIALFSDNSLNERNLKILKPVAMSLRDQSDWSDYTFSLTHESIKYIKNPVNSRDNDKLFHAFYPSLQDRRSLLTAVFHPMHSIRAASIAMLIEYRNETIMESIQDAMITVISNLLAQISSWVTIRFEYAAQSQLAKTLRLYKHEIINLTNSVERVIEFLGSPNLKDAEASKIRDVYQDSKDTLSLFSFMTENLSMLIDSPIPVKKDHVQIYQKLLYKWENALRIEAAEKFCDFSFHKKLIYVYSDSRYLELAIYNLFINAVKYAYPRTKIYIHCEKDASTNRYVLSVTNFSQRIPEDDIPYIFDMGFRAKNARVDYPEGTGIGLWIVKKAADLLGGEAKLCEQEPLISTYNIPLLHALITDNNTYKALTNTQEYAAANDEYSRLIQKMYLTPLGEKTDAVSMVVSEYSWEKPLPKEVTWGLHEPTTMIRFEVYF